MFSKLLGIALIIHSISSFIQSFRHEDSKFALMQDGIFEDPKKTSNRLRIFSAITMILGLFFLLDEKKLHDRRRVYQKIMKRLRRINS